MSCVTLPLAVCFLKKHHASTSYLIDSDVERQRKGIVRAGKKEEISHDLGSEQYLTKISATAKMI